MKEPPSSHDGLTSVLTPRVQGRRFLSVALVFLVCLVARAVYAASVGVQIGGDTQLYEKHLRTWIASGESATWLLTDYSGRVPLFVGTLRVLQASFDDWRLALVVCQTILSATVPAFVYAAARRAGVGERGAWSAAVLAMGSYELSRWNAYVLTDSLFVTFAAAAFCAAIYALASRSTLWAVLVGIFITGAVFVRPTGTAVAAAVLLAACIVRPVSRVMIAATLVPLSLYTASSLLRPTPEGTRAEPPRQVCTHLRAGRVIWGFETFRVRPLPPLPAEANLSTVGCFTRTVTDHPGHVANVMVRRPAVFWLPVYPHYSFLHNTANVLLLGGPMLLACAALFRRTSPLRADVVRLVPLAAVLVFTIFHTLTWVEGDHRFLAPVLPAVYLLAGVALDNRRVAR